MTLERFGEHRLRFPNRINIATKVYTGFGSRPRTPGIR